MLVCFYEAVFEADLSMGLWRPPKECTHECSQPSLLLLCRNWFLTGQTGFINFSNCKNRFNQQTSSSQSYFWIQPFKTVLASWAYYIVRMMLLLKFDFRSATSCWSCAYCDGSSDPDVVGVGVAVVGGVEAGVDAASTHSPPHHHQIK